MTEHASLPIELPLRPQDELQCRRCEVHCDKVVFPGACVTRACPFVYAYEAWGHTYMGCMQGVFDVEIDLDLLRAAERRREGFGAVMARRLRCRCATRRCRRATSSASTTSAAAIRSSSRCRSRARASASSLSSATDGAAAWAAPHPRACNSRRRRRSSRSMRPSSRPVSSRAGRSWNAGWARNVRGRRPAALADRVVAVEVRAELGLRVVDMEAAETVEPDSRVDLGERRIESRRIRHVDAGDVPVARVETEAKPRMAVERIEDRGELVGRASDRAARPGGFSTTARDRPSSARAAPGSPARPARARLEARVEMRADMEDDAFGADCRCGLQRRLHR